MMDDSHALQFQFKGRLVIGSVGNQAFREFRAVVGLYLPDHKGSVQHQNNEELLGTVRTVFGVHSPVCPAGTFVLGGVLVVCVSIRHRLALNEFRIDLHLLARILGPLVRLFCRAFAFIFKRISRTAVLLKQP